jgi:type I restriction enzyme S subunit
MLPEGWEKRSLLGLITVKHGFAFKSEFFTTSGPLVLLTPGSFNESGGFKDQGEKTKFYAGDVPDGYLLKKGDMLLAMTEQAEGLLGSALIVPESSKYLHNQRLGLVQVMRPDRVSIDYLYFFFNAPNSRRQIAEQSTGTKVKHTSPDRLCSVVGLIPPLPEQKKIAQILSTWDNAISATERLFENSQKRKKGLMQQLLTGKKRLPGYGREWEEVMIGELLCESRTPSINNDPSKRLTVKLNLKGVEPREVRGTEAVDATAYFVRKAGQFIYGKQNIHKGSFGIIPYHLDGYETSQDLPAFDFTGKCDPAFFFYFMCQESFYSSLENKMSGTGSKRLNPKSFFKVKIKLPSIEMQKKIANILTTADQEIDALQKRLDHLKQEKKALMQQLLTGKRRVQVDDAA